MIDIKFNCLQKAVSFVSNKKVENARKTEIFMLLWLLNNNLLLTTRILKLIGRQGDVILDLNIKLNYFLKVKLLLGLSQLRRWWLLASWLVKSSSSLDKMLTGLRSFNLSVQKWLSSSSKHTTSRLNVLHLLNKNGNFEWLINLAWEINIYSFFSKIEL